MPSGDLQVTEASRVQNGSDDMKFIVRIEEVLVKEIAVEADTRIAARKNILEALANEEIVLSAEDYSGYRQINVEENGGFKGESCNGS